MHLVLRNRLKNKPAQFMAPNAKTITDIIKGKKQFQGFDNYPHYNGGIKSNLQLMLDIANKPKDPRQAKFADFINAAITIATDPTTIPDLSGGFLAGWRTVGSGSPGNNFIFFKTIGGNDFYWMK
jgi:hypothetical protein